jgi:hypothetical protein
LALLTPTEDHQLRYRRKCVHQTLMKSNVALPPLRCTRLVGHAKASTFRVPHSATSHRWIHCTGRRSKSPPATCHRTTKRRFKHRQALARAERSQLRHISMRSSIFPEDVLWDAILRYFKIPPEWSRILPTRCLLRPAKTTCLRRPSDRNRLQCQTPPGCRRITQRLSQTLRLRLLLLLFLLNRLTYLLPRLHR